MNGFGTWNGATVPLVFDYRSWDAVSACESKLSRPEQLLYNTVTEAMTIMNISIDTILIRWAKPDDELRVIIRYGTHEQCQLRIHKIPSRSIRKDIIVFVPYPATVTDVIQRLYQVFGIIPLPIIPNTTNTIPTGTDTTGTGTSDISTDANAINVLPEAHIDEIRQMHPTHLVPNCTFPTSSAGGVSVSPTPTPRTTMWQCLDCYGVHPDIEYGCCEECMAICHAGHRVINCPSLTSTTFTCSCGRNSHLAICNSYMTSQWQLMYNCTNCKVFSCAACMAVCHRSCGNTSSTIGEYKYAACACGATVACEATSSTTSRRYGCVIRKVSMVNEFGELSLPIRGIRRCNMAMTQPDPVRAPRVDPAPAGSRCLIM